MTPVLSTPWSVCKCSQPCKPSWCCAGRCYLKSQSSNPALLQLLKAEMGRQNCVVAQWIQKLFGFHASAAVAAVKATVPRAISTTVGDNWGSCSWSGYSKRKRDLQTQSFKTPAFVKILVTLYTTLQVLANSYTGTLSLSCSSVFLWVPVMWIQSFSWTLKNRQLWNKNTSASAGGGWSDRNINYAWMHNKIIFRKWENHLGMKKMGLFLLYGTVKLLWTWTKCTSQWCWCKWTETMFTCSEALVCISVKESGFATDPSRKVILTSCLTACKAIGQIVFHIFEIWIQGQSWTVILLLKELHQARERCRFWTSLNFKAWSL